MLIKKIQITHYKGISELIFYPKKINIIVGKNNTGKTSILEAINLFFHNEIIKKKSMGSYFNIYSSDKIIKILVTIDNKKDKLEIKETNVVEAVNTFTKDLIKRFLANLFKKTKKTPSATLFKELEKLLEGHIDDDLRSFLLKNALVLNKKNESKVYYGFEFQDIERIEPLMDYIISYIIALIPSDGKKEYKRYLDYASQATLISFIQERMKKKEDIEKQVNAIYIESPKDEIPTTYFRKPLPEDSERLHKIEKIVKENKLIKNLDRLNFDNVLFTTDEGIKAHSFDFLGDGFKAIIGLLWRLSSERIKNMIFLLDEPENHMHPGYIKELIKFIIYFSKKANIQFFITTHSPDVLDMLLSNDLEKDEKEYIKKEIGILKMDKTKDSTTIAQFLDYTESKKVKDELLLDLRGT